MALAFLAVGLAPAEAMNVSPMVVELTSTGARSTGRIQVLNVLSQPLPYEVRVYRINFGPNDQIIETPADSDFVVFPPQGLLQPNQRQMVRVQWVGGPLDSSRGYYVAINQLPVPLDPSKASKTTASVDVQLVYHMKVLVTVAPPGAAPKITVESATPIMVSPPKIKGIEQPDVPPVPGVRVTVRNSGKRYAMMAGATWTIEGKGADGKPLKVVLNSSDMGRLLGAGYVPALNGQRTFDIPTGAKFADAPISVKFSN
jgi:fimbrial chaperone protein